MVNIKKEKIFIRLSILSFILYMIIMLAFEGIIYIIVGMGFLSFLGFTYKSYLSILIFLVICYIMLLPVKYYSTTLIALFSSKSNISYFQQRIIHFILYTSFSSLIVGCVDYFLNNISIPPANQVLFILLCYLFETYLDSLILYKK